ncbi:MAG: hypothetical protein APF80_02495 [Alphaproteobacteria bacterium BRH_c36]|nr:MAG: hypothetical protein APF80_02495 [Alphaproteobacteria bacterium BRH_c36]
MSNYVKQVIVIAAAVSCVGASIPASADGSVSCSIQVSRNGGMTALTGLARASSPVSGTYEFVVTSTGSGGSSNIVQSGDFSASGGQTEELGQVAVGGGYSAKLKVRAGGRTYVCSQHS